MNIAVIGVGAIGGWLAARLALAGHEVTCVARGETLEALGGGLRIREKGQEQVAPVRACEAFERPADLVIIATKAMALAECPLGKENEFSGM